MSEFCEPVKVYFGIFQSAEDDKAFCELTNAIRDEYGKVKSFEDPSLNNELRKEGLAWFTTTYDMRKGATIQDQLTFEKALLNRLVCECIKKVYPSDGSTFHMQLRFPNDQQPMKCCAPGAKLVLDCGADVYCDWLMDGYGFPLQNWGPRAVFLIPGLFGRYPENPSYKVVSKFDRSLEMFRGSHNQCVDWISHRVPLTIKNYEIKVV